MWDSLNTNTTGATKNDQFHAEIYLAQKLERMMTV